MALHPAKNIHSALGILKNDCSKEILQRDIQGDFAVNHSTASNRYGAIHLCTTASISICHLMTLRKRQIPGKLLKTVAAAKIKSILTHKYSERRFNAVTSNMTAAVKSNITLNPFKS